MKTGDYTDTAFLESALQGQDVLILSFNISTTPNIQNNFIHAAAKAGVPWIIPNEYSSDPLNKRLTDEAQAVASKAQFRDLIEKLGKSAWIGIATGFWLDYVSASIGLEIISKIHSGLEHVSVHVYQYEGSQGRPT